MKSAAEKQPDFRAVTVGSSHGSGVTVKKVGDQRGEEDTAVAPAVESVLQRYWNRFTSRRQETDEYEEGSAVKEPATRLLWSGDKIHNLQRNADRVSTRPGRRNPSEGRNTPPTEAIYSRRRKAKPSSEGTKALESRQIQATQAGGKRNTSIKVKVQSLRKRPLQLTPAVTGSRQKRDQAGG